MNDFIYIDADEPTPTNEELQKLFSEAAKESPSLEEIQRRANEKSEDVVVLPDID